MDSAHKTVNTNERVASVPSKTRGAFTENKDNANKDYPMLHHDEKEVDVSSADARQLLHFKPKTVKPFI